MRRYEDDPVRAGVRVRTAPPEVAARGLEAPDPVADAPANDDLTDDDLTAEDLGADDLSAEDLRDDQLLLTDDPARDADPAEQASAEEAANSDVRGAFRLLLDRRFGPFFAGKLLSTAGVWIHNIVAAILAYELSGSAFVVGAVSVAQFAPQMLFAPFTGAMADRGDRRRQVIAGRMIVAFGSGSLALALLVLGVDGMPGAWPLVAAALIVGVGFVIGGPAMNAMIPSLVRPGELASAIALSSIPFTVARAGGPALGAMVAVSFGPATAFGIAAITNLMFALMLLPIKVARPKLSANGDRRIRAGVTYLRYDRGIILLLVGVGAIGIGADPVITLTPSLSASFDAGSSLVGVFASAFGVGAGLAFAVLGLLRNRIGLPRLATTGLITMTVGLAVTAISPIAGLAIVALAVAGAGMTFSLTSLSTQLQQRLPDELRGRVMALWAVAFLGSRPIAAALNGSVADVTNSQFAFVVVAIIVAAGAWICRPKKMAARPAPVDLTTAS